jgi:O-antigen/teichoic acid export membrane protein
MANVITIADRYILGGHLGAAEVALYAITVKLANLLNLLATPVNLWFPAARFLHARDADRGQAFFSTLACRATWAYTGTGALMWLAAPLILPWFAPGYEWNPLAGALLVTAAVCLAVAPPLNIGLLTEGKTRWNFAISSATALLQVILLLVLIPVLGLTGAALATCCSQAASTVLQHLGSQRSHRMQWQYRRMAVIVATAAGSTGALYLWQAHAPRHNAAIFFVTWLLMGWLTLKQPAQPT